MENEANFSGIEKSVDLSFLIKLSYCILQNLLRFQFITLLRERFVDVLICLQKNPEGEPHPKGIKEYKIDPKVHEVARIEIWAASQPFRCKSHETCQILKRTLYIIVANATHVAVIQDLDTYLHITPRLPEYTPKTISFPQRLAF